MGGELGEVGRVQQVLKVLLKEVRVHAGRREQRLEQPLLVRVRGMGRGRGRGRGRVIGEGYLGLG